jgi:hypothetical protein
LPESEKDLPGGGVSPSGGSHSRVR